MNNRLSVKLNCRNLSADLIILSMSVLLCLDHSGLYPVLNTGGFAPGKNRHAHCHSDFGIEIFLLFTSQGPSMKGNRREIMGDMLTIWHGQFRMVAACR